MIEVKKAEFIGSYTDLAKCPPAEKPEYAFIGRSNVGKSSLINMLCNAKNLAHTSGTPGKTQCLNFFEINQEWYLVDLPGYGFAKAPKEQRKQFKDIIETYLRCRTTLFCAFLLIDSCVPPQAIDIEFANWLGENNIPFVLVYTKTDRKKARQNEAGIPAFQAEFLKHWETLPQEFITSSEKNIGREEILRFIEDINKDAFQEE